MEYLDLYSREVDSYQRIDKILPMGKVSEQERIQLIYHLIGTDRAFGIFFPEFFLKEIGQNVDSLFKIYLFSRAYLIAHDAVRDKDRSKEMRELLEESEPLFRKECLTAMQESGSCRAEEIIKVHDRIANNAYSSDFSEKVPSATFTSERISHWYLIFDILKERGIPVEKRKKLFYSSLFLLQIADDFSDIDEDTKKDNNCNLLAWNKGNQITLDIKTLEKYALISIWYSAKNILREFENQEPISLWAREILSMIRILNEERLERYCQKLFPGKWPESYLPPHLNSQLKISEIPDINLITMNGIRLSAESINSFASNRAINKLIKTK